MNKIKRLPLSSLGYGFIDPKFIPKGMDEYYLRNIQNRSGILYRNLSAHEIEVLVKNGNTTDNWNNILVSNAFNPNLVQNCKFYGLIRIGKLEPYTLEFNALRVAVGLYNSTIISCDLGDNVAISNVSYLSHYILGNEVIIVQVDEMKTTSMAKFGNGILKDGEEESTRIWLEICNENGGRKVIPFNGMLPGDAWLWSKYRDDKVLLQRFLDFTEFEYKTDPGFYGKVGDRTVIKNTNIINDVWIGSDAYIKGANKLKNLTIKSRAEAKTQIGEGCELVNGIIEYGCRIFYGVKAVRFVMASNSQLKYGARLINSYLGNNATISCCEVLNSLIFPAHEQHHNNSFLCAALIQGQSNIPAGATIGSNHNTRGADGELVAGRGFWPGLCVSLKHSTKLASFTILAKGDYDYELNLPLPFSLVSIDYSHNNLIVMPAYWILYNMYALQRNTYKYQKRDNRYKKTQGIEYEYLAPDTVNEMFKALYLLKEWTGKAYASQFIKESIDPQEYVKLGEKLLEAKDPIVSELLITANEIENSKRPVVIKKAQEAYSIFKRFISFYGITHLLAYLEEGPLNDQLQTLKDKKREEWLNVGSQLIPTFRVSELRESIRKHEINSWKEVHEFYKVEAKNYKQQKQIHAVASLMEIKECRSNELTLETLTEWIKEAMETKKWMVLSIEESRKKDYTNPFRKMMHDTEQEMEEVLGRLEDDEFIIAQKEELKTYTEHMTAWLSKLEQLA